MFAEVATPTNIVVFAVALVLLLVGALGGWQRVRAAEVEVPVVKAGEAVDAAPFRVTIQDVWSAEQSPSFLLPWKGKRVVMVRGAVKSTATGPLTAMDDFGQLLRVDLPGCSTALAPRPAEDCKPTEVQRTTDLTTMDDLGRVVTLQPGVPMGFVAVFLQDASQPAPTRVQVTIRSQTHRRSSLEDAMIWADPVPVGRVLLDVRDWSKDSWGKK